MSWSLNTTGAGHRTGQARRRRRAPRSRPPRRWPRAGGRGSARWWQTARRRAPRCAARCSRRARRRPRATPAAAPPSPAAPRCLRARVGPPVTGLRAAAHLKALLLHTAAGVGVSGEPTLAVPHQPLHISTPALLSCLQSAQAVQQRVVDGATALVPQLCCAASLSSIGVQGRRCKQTPAGSPGRQVLASSRARPHGAAPGALAAPMAFRMKAGSFSCTVKATTRESSTQGPTDAHASPSYSRWKSVTSEPANTVSWNSCAPCKACRSAAQPGGSREGNGAHALVQRRGN
jgi:hypothetical protein